MTNTSTSTATAYSGGGSTSIDIDEKISVKRNFYALGFGLGYQPDNKTGFCFMWNNDLGFGKKAILTTDSDTVNNALKNYVGTIYIEKISANYKIDFIFGAVIVPVQNLYITLGTGTVINKNKIYSRDDRGTIFPMSLFFEVPFDVNAKYYFTNHVGVLLSLNDTLAYGLNFYIANLSDINSASPILDGFTNAFSVKAGLRFKF